MSFWLAAALLTFLACAALLMPFRRGALPAVDHAPDIDVYRDQLRELDRDAARGVIGTAEAAEARAEIGRRLLKAADAAGSAGSAGGRAGRIAATVAILSVPLVAWGGYAVTGSPAVPDQRLAERLSRNPTENTVEELIARAEQHLAANPSDGRGWEVLAPIYMRTGRAADAVTAWRSAIRLNGASAQREAGLGEALTSVAAGVVTAEADEAFARALALDPNEPRARFFRAMALMQEGKTAEAAAAWQAMAGVLPADSPWQQVVGRALASVQAPAPGPSAQDVAAAQEMAPEDRRAMIEGMVASLDAKLRDNPADAEGWQRLVRSYMVLGRQDEAAQALSRGVAALGEATDAGRALAALATELGVQVTR
jgi:cytochrome c-type biogenesis protein CcmH